MAVIQQVGFDGGAGTTKTVTLSQATTAGNTLIVFSSSGTQQVASGVPTDNLSDTWPAASVGPLTNNKTVCYVYQNCPAGITSVTVNQPACQGWIVEESGVIVASLDKATGQSSTGTTVTSGSTGTLAQANEVCYGFFSHGSSGNFSAGTNWSSAGFTNYGGTGGSGYTAGNQGNTLEGSVTFIERQVVSATTSLAATATITSSTVDAGIITLKQSTAGPFAYVEGYTQGLTYDTTTSFPAFTNSVAVNDLIVVALNLISYSSFSPVVSDNVNTGNYIIANNFNNTATTQGWVYLYMPCNASCGTNTLVITVYANNSHYGGGQSSALHFNGFTAAPTLDTSATAFYTGTAASVSQAITNTTTPELLIGQLWSGNVQAYTGGMTPTNLGGAGSLQSPAYSNLGAIVAETYSATFTSDSYALYLVGFYNSSAPSPTLLGQICL